MAIAAIAAGLYMVGALSWSMPEGTPLKLSLDNQYRTFFQWSGLWQGWDMFAPQPRDEDIFINSEIYFKDGTRKTWTLTRMTDFPALKRYQKERWRKFFNDNLRLDSNKAMWNAAAAWVFRETSTASGPGVERIELVRNWRKSLPPDAPGDVLNDLRPYNRFVFHSWKAP